MQRKTFFSFFKNDALKISFFQIFFLILGKEVEQNMHILTIILAVIVVALLVFVYFERKRCFVRGYQQAQRLVDSNLEILNFKIWSYNIKDGKFSPPENIPAEYQANIDSFAKIFSPSDAETFIAKINSLKDGVTEINKFCAKLNADASPARNYAYISMTAETHRGRTVKILGTFCQTPENIFEFVKGIPSFVSFKTLFEEIPVGVILCSADGVVENVNQQLLTIFGIESKSAFLSKNFNINTDPYYKGPSSDVLKRTGRIVMIEDYDFNNNPLNKRTGKATLLYTAKMVTDLKGIEHIFITVNDISSNILYDDRFHSMYVNGKTILKMSPVGVSIFDYDGGRIFINDEFAATMGIKDVTKFMRKRHNIWQSPVFDAFFRDQIAQHNNAHTIVTIDFSSPVIKEYFDSDLEGVRYFQTDYRKITNPDGSNATFIITCLDVTAIETERTKNQILTRQRDTLIELGGFIPFVYDPPTHTKEYISKRQFPDLKDVEKLPDKLYINDFVLLSRNLMQVINREVESARFIVKYKTDGNKFEPYDMLIKNIEVNNTRSVLCVARCISEISGRSLDGLPRVKDITELPRITRIGYDVLSGNIKYLDKQYLLDNLQHIITFVDDAPLEKLRAGEKTNIHLEGSMTLNATKHHFYVNFSPLNYADDKKTVVEYIGAYYEKNEHLISQESFFAENLVPLIVENLPCMFYIKDIKNDYRYVIANKNYCKALNMLPIEIIGKNDYAFMGLTPDAQKYRNDDNKAIALGTYEFDDYTDFNNNTISWRIRKSYIRTRDNGEYIISSAIDISELKAAQDNYERAQKAAEHAKKVEQAFLNNVNHEIRTPLHAIVGFSQLLSDSKDENKKAHFSHIITEQSQKLANIIGNLLDISKIEAGDIKIVSQAFDLSMLMEEQYNRFADVVVHPIVFSIKNQYSHYTITADRAKTVQIVQNYIQNAINNTFSGRITIGFDTVPGKVRIFVQDTGRGIKEEDKPKVFFHFEKFNQFSDGLGLGLPISKALAEAMGGSVEFKSQYGTGSTFYLILPDNNGGQ